MSSAAHFERQRPYIAGTVCGLWAAAIALAPSIEWKAALAAPAAALPVVWWTAQRPGRWVLLFLASALLLPPLPIAIGDSGPHVCLAFAAIGLFVGVLLDGGRMPAGMPAWQADSLLHGVHRALIALFGALLVSVAFAAWYSGVTAAAGSLARVGLFGISVYVYFFVVRHADGMPSARALHWIAVGSALFACVDFYFQFPAPAGFGPQFVWLDSGVYRRAQGFFYEASTLGNFCAFFLVGVCVWFSRRPEERPVSRLGLVAGGAVLFAALVMSYSRASLVNLAIAVTMLLWVNRRRLRVTWIAAGGAAGALVVWQVFPQFAEMYWLRLSTTAEFLFTATNGVLSGRVASWGTLAEWIAAHPWQTMFGIGYKTLPYTEHLGAPIVADNMYLSLLVETGVAGLAALVWLNVAVLRASWRASRRGSAYGTWMLCFWAGEVAQMASGDLLTYWRVLPVYFYVLGRACIQRGGTENAEDTRRGF